MTELFNAPASEHPLLKRAAYTGDNLATQASAMLYQAVAFPYSNAIQPEPQATKEVSRSAPVAAVDSTEEKRLAQELAHSGTFSTQSRRDLETLLHSSYMSKTMDTIGPMLASDVSTFSGKRFSLNIEPVGENNFRIMLFDNSFHPDLGAAKGYQWHDKAVSAIQQWGKRMTTGAFDYNVDLTADGQDAIRSQAENVAASIKGAVTGGRLPDGRILQDAYRVAIQNRSSNDSDGSRALHSLTHEINQGLTGTGYDVTDQVAPEQRSPGLTAWLAEHPGGKALDLRYQFQKVKEYGLLFQR